MACPWFYIFFLFSCFCIDYAFSSPSTTLPYSQHCSTIVPESAITIPTNQISVPHFTTAHFTGGDRILAPKPGNWTYVFVRKSLTLRIIPEYYETVATGIHQVKGLLYIMGESGWRRTREQGLINFSLSGFWSEVSRTICMVGSASWKAEDGKKINLDAVLKLKFASVDNPTIYNGAVSGSLESTGSGSDPGYFEPILIFGFSALRNYSYVSLSKEVSGEVLTDSDVWKKHSLDLGSDKFCSVLAWRPTFMELEYAMECREDQQHCSFNGVGLTGSSLPRYLYFNPIECSDEERKLRYMATFQNVSIYDDRSFTIDSTVVGEAMWDDRSNELKAIVCRLLNTSSNFGHAVGDCTMRMSVRYPSILTIRNESRVVGQFWSSKAVGDSGYFRKIGITSSDDNGDVTFPGRGYEYTELDNARKSCPVQKAKKGKKMYPDGNSYDLRFHMSIKNSKNENVANGDATPLSVGDDLRQGYSMIVAAASTSETKGVSKPENISYKIFVYPFYDFNSSWFPSLSLSLNLYNRQVEIMAEGVYNGGTGHLCMVGCRRMVQSSIVSRDCDILVKFQFAPLNAKRGGLTKGTIQSTRAKTDPLYFDDLIIQPVAYSTVEAKRTIRRMDIEITMVLISNTLACIFVALQIFHVKRSQEVSSSVSVVMLVILTVEHMIPLVLNHEAVFLRTHTRKSEISNGGLVEANEVTVRVVTLVAFMLHIRLLQLVWSGKLRDASEKKAGFASLALYIAVGLLALLLNWIRSSYAHVQEQSEYSPLWGNLRSCTGLILDGFLLPQILLNMFMGSAERALSHPFYIGVSAIRLLPHAYNQYRVHRYPRNVVRKTYYYANPAMDFYSIAWDVMICCGIIVLAVVVFLQQRYGGRCVLPKRFR